MQTIKISSQDFWFKVVDMLQQNWAVIETGKEKSKFKWSDLLFRQILERELKREVR